MRAPLLKNRRGLTLIELMVAVSMMGLFLALAYEPLLRVMSHPRWAQRVSRDRNTAVTVERYLVDAFRKTVDGKLWTSAEPTATYLLLSQGSSYKGRDKPTLSGYDFFYHDQVTERLFRYRLTVDEVHSVTGVLRAGSTISPQHWTALTALPNRSLVASELMSFGFEPPLPGTPAAFELKVSSFPRKKAHDPTTEGLPENPPFQAIRREIAQVHDEN